MAIYHHKPQILGRSNGHSAIAAAAYRRGIYLVDERTGLIHDYSRKKDVVHSEILVPEDSPPWINEIKELEKSDSVKASSLLWNSVERAEKRIDAQLARELNFALPIELSIEQNIILARDFIKTVYCNKGMVADFNIHWDKGNPHLHVMLSTRALDQESWGQKVRAWNDKSLNLESRRLGAEIINRHLELAGFDIRVSHLSYAEQGIDLIPTIHEGSNRNPSNAQARARNNEIRLKNLQKVIEDPGILLTKLSQASSYFNMEDIVVALSPYLEAANTKNFGASLKSSKLNSLLDIASEKDQQITLLAPVLPDISSQPDDSPATLLKKVLNVITKNEAVFNEKLLTKVIMQHLKNPELIVEALAQIKNSTELLALGPGEDGRERYTTREMFNLENYLQEVAEALNKKARHKINGHSINKVINKYQLKEDQAKAIRHILRGQDITIIVGRAGTGKSYSLKAAREAWEDAGFNVQGIALAGIAADNLEKDSGIKSRTIESFCLAIKTGALTLGEKDIIVMDEAGMTDSISLSKVLLAVSNARSKLVLVGDPEQLQPVGPGAIFRALVERIGFAELTTIRRQSVIWQREATALLAAGKTDKALSYYEDHNCITLSQTIEKAQEALVQNWNTILSDGATLSDTLILAFLNKDVEMLNQLARQKLVDEHKLALGDSITTSKGKINIAIGERLTFLENNWRYGVKNGQRGTILQLEKDIHNHIINITVAIDGKDKPIIFQPEKYKNFYHGYAVTVHRSQGSTVDHSLVLGSGRWNKHLSYVAMSRHRKSAHIHADKDTFSNTKKLKLNMGRESIKDNVSDYPLAFAFRRGIDAETISDRVQKHLLDKIKWIASSIKNNFEETFFPNRYWQNKAAEREKNQALKEMIERRTDAKLVATYVDANQAFGKAWESVKSARESARLNYDPKINSELLKDFYVLKEARNSIASQIYKEHGKYTAALNYYQISLEKLRMQANEHKNQQSKVNYEKFKERNGIVNKDYIISAADKSQNIILTDSASKKPLQEISVQKEFIFNAQLSEEQKYEIANVRKIVQESTPIKGSLAERYLKEYCNISDPASENLRFHPGIYEPETQRIHPALLAVARDRNKEVQSFQSIYLDKETANKLNVSVPKRTHGPMGHAAVLIQKGSGSTIALADGVETALSVAQDKTLQIYATFDSSNFSSVPLSPNYRSVLLCADNDGPGSNTEKAIEKATQVLSARGFNVKHIKPKNIGDDFNDVLKKEGIEAIKQATQQAKVAKPAFKIEQFTDKEKEAVTYEALWPVIEFKKNLKTYNEYIKNSSEENVDKIAPLYKETGELALMIKKHSFLIEAVNRHGLGTEISYFTDKYNETLKWNAKAKECSEELKSKDPVADYKQTLEEQKALKAPWSNPSKGEKEKWYMLDTKMNKLSLIITSNPRLSYEAKKMEIDNLVKNKAQYYRQVISQNIALEQGREIDL